MTEDLEARIATALDAHQAGDRERAGALYAELRAEAPDEPTLLYLHGAFLFEAGDLDGAAAACERLAALMPDHAEARRAHARIRHARGETTLAKGEYEAALAIEPDDVQTLVTLARLLVESGAAEAALDVAERAGSLAPDAPSVAMARALALNALQRPVEALAALAGAGIGADQAEAAEMDFLEGALRLRLGEAERALEALSRVLAVAPGHAAAWAKAGAALFELDRKDEAEAAYRRAVEMDPSSVEAWTSLSSVLALSQKHDEALLACEEALARDPDQPVARQNLAAILEGRGDLEGARRHREILFSKTRFMVETSPREERRALLLVLDGRGTVPHRDLLPKSRYTKISWFISGAAPSEWRDLPPFDFVFNAVGDADLAGPALAPTLAFMAACPGPVINDPHRVMATDREASARLLADIEGLKVPQIRRFSAAEAGEGLASLAARSGLATPLLLRPNGSHGGHGLLRIADEAALATAAAPKDQDFYLSEFVDFASDDGWHRKYRVIFVEGRAYPYHLAISQNWLVHYETARMGADADRKAEEARFLADPEAALGAAAWRAIEMIGEKLGLDFAGVDFSVLPDGRALLFEANATMLVHEEDESGPYAHKVAAARAICAAFQAMAERKLRPRSGISA